MVNQLKKLNPPLFGNIVGFGLLDVGWGAATLLLPTSALTEQQSALITGTGVKVLGTVLLLKGLAILYACFLSARYQVIQKMMILGFLLWGAMALLAFLAFIGGQGTSVFALFFFMSVLWNRWLVFSFVPPRETT